MRSLARQATLIFRNDLRLLWRDLRAQRLASSLALLGVIFLSAHLISITLFIGLKRGPTLAVETFTWLFFILLILRVAMNLSIKTLFERSDFELLLSSPVSSRAVLLARLSAIAAGASFSVALLLPALLDGAILTVSWRYVWGYAVWLLLAFIAASISMWGALLLVRCLGPRRAHVWGQVVATMLATLLFIAFQSQNLFSEKIRHNFSAALTGITNGSAVSFVARAGRGELPAMLVLAMLAVAFGSLTIWLLSKAFIIGVQDAAPSQPKQTKPLKNQRWQFNDRIGQAAFRKDLRLIIRNPLVLSKVLPPVLYVLPVLLLAGRAGKIGASRLLAPYAVFVAVALSLQLTALAVSTEAGWDLIRSSPTSTARIRIAKIAACMAPPLVLCGVLTSTIAMLGQPGLAIISVFLALVCASAACWVETARIRPSPRTELIQRSHAVQLPSLSQIISGIVFIIGGPFGAGLAATGRKTDTAVALGVISLFAISCFTLVRSRDIEN